MPYTKMKFELIIFVLIYTVSGSYVSTYYTMCRDNPCDHHEICKDNFVDPNSYSCCLRLHGTERYCTIHTKAKSLKEMAPLALSLFFSLVFTVAVWCIMQYLIKKVVNCCIRIGISNRANKFFRRARVLFGRKTSRVSQNRTVIPITTIVVPTTRSLDQPPVYELPPSYENATKQNSGM